MKAWHTNARSCMYYLLKTKKIIVGIDVVCVRTDLMLDRTPPEYETCVVTIVIWCYLPVMRAFVVKGT